MDMSDEQFEVYNALINFVDELIDKEQDEKEKLKLRKKISLRTIRKYIKHVNIFTVYGRNVS